MPAAAPCPCVFVRASSFVHRDGFHRHVRWGHDPADHQFVDQDPSRDHLRDVGRVHQDVLQGHQDAGRYDQGWMRKNDPYDPKRRGAARHRGVVHESLGLVGDVPAVVERGCHLAAAEWCDHRQARCAGRSMAEFPAVARVCRVQWADDLRVDDW